MKKSASSPKTAYVSISDLILLEKNPRKISDENFAKLKKSIKKNPKYFWARPVLANNASGKNIVYAGNQRLRAALDLGMKEVPCLIETLSDKEQDERTVRDNVELGQWDTDLLVSEFGTEDLSEWGVDLSFGGIEATAFDVPASPGNPASNLLDDLEENAFSKFASAQSEFFAVTFNFPKEERPKFEAFIRSQGKEALCAVIIDFIHTQSCQTAEAK